MSYCNDLFVFNIQFHLRAAGDTGDVFDTCIEQAFLTAMGYDTVTNLIWSGN